MAQVHQIQSVVQGVTRELQSRSNSQTPTTHSTTGDRFTREQKVKTVLFFNRLRLIYGHRFAVQWPDEQTVKLARREWAREIDSLGMEELEKALERAKAKLVEGDGDFYWPDVGRILGLARENRTAAHKVFPPALPPSEAVVSARRKAGRQGLAKVWQALGGSHAE
jgi:hypothetical protein